MGKNSAFARLGGFVCAHPILIFFIFAALAGLAVYYIRDFPLRTSYLDLLPAGEPLVEKYEAVQAELAGLDVAAILLSLKDPPEDLAKRAEILITAAKKIIAELDPRIVARASYALPADTPLPPELLVFRTLYPEERERLSQIAAELLARVPALADSRTFSFPAALPEDLAELARALGELVAAGHALLNTLPTLPEVQSLVEEAREILGRAEKRAVPKEPEQPLLSLDHTKLVIQVWPTQPVYASQAFNRAVRDELLRAVREAKVEELGVEVGITGGYVVSTEVEDVIRHDMAVVTIISGVAVVIVTILVLGSLVLAALALIPVLASAVLIVAWAKYAVHGFNLLTTFLPALVLGLGIDYAIHLLARFSVARQGGLEIKEAAAEAVRTKGPAAFVAALTTTAVFCCLLFSRSRALGELGVIMALGVPISFVTVFLLGPALLTGAGKIFPRLRGRPFLVPDRLQPAFRRVLFLSKGIILVCVVLILIFVVAATKVEFKFASGELAPATPGQAVLHTILTHFGSEIWLGDTFRVFVPRTQDLAELSEKLREHPLVQEVVSARKLLPTELLGQAAALRDMPIAPAREGLHLLSSTLEKWPELADRAESIGAALSILELKTLMEGRVSLAQDLSLRAQDLFLLADELRAVDPQPFAEAAAAIAAALPSLENFVQKLRTLPPEDQLIDQILNLLPQEIRAQYKISRGYIIEIRVSPHLYEGRNLQEFLHWLRGFGVDYVGSPEIQLVLEEHMRRDFFLTTGIAVILIFLVVFGGFRHPGRALLALIPLGMGYTAMLGGMAALKLRFNFTNIVISPLLVGYGVDGAVYFLHRVEEERTKGREAVAWAAAHTTGPTLGSYLTTMASFGALLAAQTPGLRFLGASALLGLGFTLLWTVLFLPAVIGELRKSRGGTKVAQ
ncbi:MMPL family transporter [Candidatus Bipolaricaulota bacterium]|nr:MMPL family transporter [Candidatus Bipolaricaulota bacterium]